MTIRLSKLLFSQRIRLAAQSAQKRVFEPRKPILIVIALSQWNIFIDAGTGMSPCQKYILAFPVFATYSLLPSAIRVDSQSIPKR